MILDRNIGDDANISAHKLNLLQNAGAETFYVGTAGTAAYLLATTRIPQEKLFTTINTALAAMTASRGDNLVVLPNHAESIGDTSSSGAMDFDVAGINVIGLGSGSAQPKITFAHADADLLIGANNISISNLHFFAAITLVKIGVQIEAAVTGTNISNCKFSVEETTVDEFLIGINLLAGCDDTYIVGCDMDMGLGGAAAGIKLVGASAGVRIRDNDIAGDYSLGCLSAITTLSTDLRIERNLLMNGNANALGAVAVADFITGCLGVVRDNTIFSDVATHLLMFTADTMIFSNNWRSDDSGSAATTALTSASVVASADA